MAPSNAHGTTGTPSAPTGTCGPMANGTLATAMGAGVAKSKQTERLCGCSMMVRMMKKMMNWVCIVDEDDGEDDDPTAQGGIST